MPYTEIAAARPFEGAPKINTAGCIGASAGKPILIRIAATGERPIEFTAAELPEGLVLDGNVIRGSVEHGGEYAFSVTASNVHGAYTKKITLEVGFGGVPITPLMGFTSWNAFGFFVTQQQMEDTARRMLELGIAEYGYDYINIDSGWQGEYGGKFDAIMPNAKFPDMKGFCERMHAQGFKCGIYSTPMLHAFGCSMNNPLLPPGCTQGEPDPRFADERGGIGVIRKERNNALQWADWGFDYLKYDWRPSDPYNAELMRSELAGTDRDFGFCVTVRARPEYHTYWSKYCQSYRNNPDSKGYWSNLMEIYRTYFENIEYINKGHYFDLDMLDTGRSMLFEHLRYTERPDFGYTEDEQLVLYTMRAFLSSPIQLSCVLDEVSDFEMSMYCNDEIIAISQDCAFSAARPVMMLEQGEQMLHVFRKKLEGGDYALCAFNLGKTSETLKLFLDGYSNVRDVWAKRDLKPCEVISLSMQPHTVRVFRITPISE